MFDFLLAPENVPFTTALTMMVIIAFLETVGAIIGTGFSSLLENLIPHADLDYDLDPPDPSTFGPLGKAFSLFSFGRVPVLVLFIIFLFVFGLTGLLIQDYAQSFLGSLFPAFKASTLAMLATFPLMKGITSILSKIIPQDETNALSQNSFIGSRAEIILGIARKGYPAQAKTTDRFGKVHYFMLEPEKSEEIFNEGTLVLLVKYDGVRFLARNVEIKNE